ncbi:MAG: hypothetical protein LBB23_03675 [Rickettsiales bacterium]|jgi:hypothetical protein|nr:hypothetical protein [Rickettsiales bacterium]
MSVKLKVYVSDSAESRKFHAEKMYKTLNTKQHRDAKILAPSSTLGEDAAKKGKIEREYIKDFSAPALRQFFENDLIIEDAHLLCRASLDALIDFCRNSLCSVHIFGQAHNFAGGVYENWHYLADEGYTPEQLEDFAASGMTYTQHPNINDMRRIEKQARKDEGLAPLPKAPNPIARVVSKMFAKVRS